MKRNTNSEEQIRDFSQSLLEKMKKFFKDAFQKEKQKHGDELKDYLVSQAKTEEEKETIEEMLEEIETFYKKRKEFVESGKEISVWYKDEIERIVREIKPDATQTDIDQVMESLAKQIDFEVEETALTLETLNEMVNKEMGEEGKQ